MDALKIYLSFVVPFVVLLPLVAGFKNFAWLKKGFRLLVYYLVLSAITSIAGVAMAWYHINNLYLFHFYTIAEFILIAAFYGYEFRNKPIARIAIMSSMALFALVCLINIIYFQHLSEFNTYTRSLEAVLIIIMNICLMQRQSFNLTVKKWSDSPINWFNTGILLYFSGSLFLFLLSNYLMKAGTTIIYIAWGMHGTFLLFLYLLFAIGFIKAKNERQHYPAF